jgi:hypothetical protein
MSEQTTKPSRKTIARCSWCGDKLDEFQAGTFFDDAGNPLCEPCWDTTDEGIDDA